VISFGPSEEQELVRDAMREFAADAIRPIARACDEASEIPQDFLETAWSLGLTSTQIPEAYGGAGEARSLVTNAILVEELAVGDATLAIAAVAPSLFANAILDQGTEAQKQALLPRFCGETFATGALAVVEPGALADASRPRTVAEAKGTAFVLSGQKTAVVMGDRASHFLVTARVASSPCSSRLAACQTSWRRACCSMCMSASRKAIDCFLAIGSSKATRSFE